jgi:hypothetical protein
MKLGKSSLVAMLVLSLNAMTLNACTPVQAKSKPVVKPVIQLAILLDTSNSMDGLIDQARSQLWRVVNELGAARKGGVMPELQVALYEYGNDSLPADKGHIRQVLPFTTDLDRISEELFALKTNGGNEFCGHVIDDAVRSLQWSNSANDLKVIFIAGNEEYTQGDVDYRTSTAKAIGRGIIVNTIYCGDKGQGLRTNWGAGASMAEGHYVAIDQNAQVAEIDAPQDDEIAALGARLNNTYVAYGAKGSEGLKRQSTQDHNIAAKKGANVQRQIAKSSANYNNASWDLVDAKKSGTVDLEKIKTSELPEKMRSMSVAERKAYVARIEAERETIRKRIVALDAQRKQYVAAKQKQIPLAASTLDEAVVSAVRASGRKRGFTF